MLLTVLSSLLLTALTVSSSNHHCCRMFNFPSHCHFRQSLYADSRPSPNYYGTGPAAYRRYVQWYKPLVNAGGTHACKKQGVLRINPGFHSYQAEKVHVYLGICNPYRFSFNVGDQSTNNGFGGGDPGTDEYCAEIHNYNNRMLIYENPKWKRYPGPPVALNYLPNYFNPVGSVTWHLELDKCNRLRMSTSPNIKGTDFSMRDDQMFRYDDFYLGINRVVNTRWPFPPRTGAGVCEVCIRFEDVSFRPPCHAAGSGYCRPSSSPFSRTSSSKIVGTLDKPTDIGDPNHSPLDKSTENVETNKEILMKPLG